MNDILVLCGLTRGEEAKLRRVALGWRQLDLASLAKVTPIVVTALEKDRYVLPTKLNRMLYWLEMPLYTHEYLTLERAAELIEVRFGNEKEIYWEQRKRAEGRHMEG